MFTETLTDNATTVAKLYDAFGRGDVASILDNIADDCTWIGAGEGSLPQGGTYKGKEALNFFRRMGENEEFNSFTPISINNINDSEVVAFGDMTATTRATGVKITCDWVMHWRFNEEGKVIYFQDFFDTAAAYLAATKNDIGNASQKQAHITLVKNTFENFLKGNIQGILDICAEDVVWSGHENTAIPYSKKYYGKQGVAEFFKAVSANIDFTVFEPKEYYAEGNKVFVKGYHEAKVKATGRGFAHDFLMEFTLRDGRVAAFFGWTDTCDQARAFED